MSQRPPSEPTSPANAGLEITFAVNGHPCLIDLEPPGDLAAPSVFLVGLPKAGSTLLANLAKPIVRAARLTFVSVPTKLRKLGVPPGDIPPEVNAVFRPNGYAFGGFRGLPGALSLPPYASGRTILLVRDPRDMLTSLYFTVAFSHKAPGDGAGGKLAARFEKGRREAAATDIDTFVLSRTKVVTRQYKAVERKLAAIAHKTYRYEDVIFEKAAWARDMVDYLGLEVEQGAIDRAVAANDVRPETEDVTRHVRTVTPGDHARKLKPETIAALDEALAPIIATHGYA